MLKKHYLVDGIIVIIIILFLQFFSYTKLPDIKLLLILSLLGVMGFAFTIYGFLTQKFKTKHPLDKLVFAFVCCFILSSFTANIYWNQSFESSLKSCSNFYVYFLYFVFIILEVQEDRIERILKVLFFLSLFIFLIDYKTFPDPLFSYRSEERRNGITIFFYGQGFTFLGGFYFLNKFFEEKKIINLGWFLAACFCLFMLTQARMNLLALAIGFFLLLIFSNFSLRYLLTFALIIGGFVFYSTSSVFTGIKDETKAQAQFYKEDVRVQAHNYFINEMQGGIPTQIFGNGLPGADSDLELQAKRGKDKGFWTADVGLTGIFSYFGIVGVIIWLLFFYNAFKTNYTSHTMYLKAYFLTILTTAFAGYSIFEPGYMPATVSALYLIRCSTLSNYNDEEEDLEGLNPN